MTLQVTAGGFDQELPLSDGNKLRFVVRALRLEPSGVHGRIYVFRNDVCLSFTNINIERHSERVTLSNSAHKMLGADKDYMPTDTLKHYLDLFCKDVIDQTSIVNAPVMEHGDPMGAPQTYLAEPHVLEEGGTILYGERGGGKSYTALLVGVAIDAGVNSLWHTKQRKIMYINLERPPSSIRRRIGHVNGALGLDFDRPLMTLHARGKKITDIRDSIAEAVFREDIGGVILDSISRAGMGNLNDNAPANDIMDALNGVAPSWLAIAHPPRGGDNVFGSIMFENAADVIVRLKSQRDGDRRLGVRLEIEKANDLPPTKPLTFDYRFDDDGLTQASKSTQSEFTDLYAEGKVKNSDKLFEWLINEKQEATAGEAAREFSMDRTAVSRIFSNDKRFIPHRQGKETFYRAVVREAEPHEGAY